jgi:hypothetical protein
MENQNGYICFYNSQTVEIRAKSSFAAQQEAAKILRVKENKRYLISVVLCESKEGKQVTHKTSGF